MESLQLIKPKTLSSDSNVAYLYKKDCLLDFGMSKVLLNGALDSEWPLTVILQRHLFNNYFSEANQIESDIIFNAPNISWNIIPINLMDVSVFNSITSAGETLFWHAKLHIAKNNFQIRSVGLNYVVTHDMAKVLDWVEVNVNFSIDYNVFYYLNQMFKKVTKTKPQNLLIGLTKENTWITNELKEFFIIIPTNHNEFKVKDFSFEKIISVFENRNYSAASNIDRISYGKTAGSLFKHITKCLDDTINVGKTKEIIRFSNQFTKVYMCEAKS